MKSKSDKEEVLDRDGYIMLILALDSELRFRPITSFDVLVCEGPDPLYLWSLVLLFRNWKDFVQIKISIKQTEGLFLCFL